MYGVKIVGSLNKGVIGALFFLMTRKANNNSLVIVVAKYLGENDFISLAPRNFKFLDLASCWFDLATNRVICVHAICL